MNLEIVKKRFDTVIATDATAESKEDFFATHVPINQLILLDNYEFQPSLESQRYSEEKIYKDFISNPNNIHQFIAVYGEAGTGKSHLIRWFKERYEQDKPDNEVILFLSRNDNSLKGTIKQLLNKPEVQNIENKELYDRLTNASSSIEPQKLKDLIYHNFIIEVNADLESSDASDDNVEHEVVLRATTKKRLPAFLANDIVRKHMLRENGPIDRIFSKVAEQAIVNIDLEAKFYDYDFTISQKMYDEIENSGADNKAVKLTKQLITDDTGIILANDIAKYLNEFVDTVIQTCAGIEPTDFELLFTKIREQLYSLGKNLTVFIEDITSTTGVNKAILSALMTEHRAVVNNNVCRISSIVGSTSGYFQSDIRGNYQQRVTKYVYIPTGVFTNDSLYEFVGKYLNTLSLEESVISSWVKNGLSQDDYPVHKPVEGKHWDSYKFNGKEISLYPFTKKAILTLYETRLEQKTPRYIIKELIKPVVTDIIYNINSFPDNKYSYREVIDTNVQRNIHSKVSDSNLVERLLRLMNIWGNGKDESYTKDGVKYISGLNEYVYKDFGLPIIDFREVEYVEETDKITEEITNIKSIEEPKDSKELETNKKVSLAISYLEDWINGKEMDTSSSKGTEGVIYKAINNINNFVITSINWQAEDMSLYMREVVSQGSKLIYFENTKQDTKGLMLMNCNRDSLNIILSFIRWQEFGGGTWNYSDSYIDCYIVRKWFHSIKQEIVKLIKNEEVYRINYIDYALASEIYRQILFGDLKNKDLKKLEPVDFFANNIFINNENSHCDKWKQATGWLKEKNRFTDNLKTIKTTYDISQGLKETDKIVINYPKMSEDIKRVIKELSGNNLIDNIPEYDYFKKRHEVCKYYKSLKNKADKAITDEFDFVKKDMQYICNIFDIDYDDAVDDEEITDLFIKFGEFYSEVNKTDIHLENPDLISFNSKVGQMVKSINSLNKIVDSGVSMDSFVKLSNDPLLKISDFILLLKKVEMDINEVDKKLKMNNLSENDNIYFSDYKNEETIIVEDLESLKMLGVE